ncbi:MAG: deoxyribose-phosphate aldolase [Rubrimonas sp.]|uniref:deoxyribose-phosphate aldolase n=1 Tax=Rubrimonas sp. TaxID=2036015 RepID=UPI002FDD84F3
MSMTDAEVARRALECLDLTDLGEFTDAEDVEALCARALASPVKPASVCVWPKHVATAAEALTGSGIKVATVINFPAGGEHLNYVLSETEQAGWDGAAEIDLVMPYRAFAEGRAVAAERIVRGVRGAAKARKMKVILESGLLHEPELIRRAADFAVSCGADFLKTSTGKVEIGATPEAVAQMLAAIQATTREVGLKVSGGVRTLADARLYMEMAIEAKGADWIAPATFRIGASSLLAELQAALEGAPAPAAPQRPARPGGY